MSIAAELGITLHDPSRLVYVADGTGPSVIDAWDATTGLVPRLARARELVLLDPLSFPYELLPPRRRDELLIVVVLPDGWSPTELDQLLGSVVLRHLTPADVVIGDPALMAALDERGVLGAARLVEAPAGADRAALLHALWQRERTRSCDASFGSFTGFADDLVTHHVEELGAHQRSDLAMLLSTVRAGDTVVDCGAHVGSFAVPLARRVGPDGRLVAFEPHVAAAELLQHNLAANDLPWADVHVAAVVRGPGQAVVATPVPRGNTGAAAVRRAWAGAPGRLPATSLDVWWREAGEPRVDVVKLDVEGGELDALTGARALVEAHHPVLLVELAAELLLSRGTGPAQVLRFLARRGYSFWRNDRERNRPDDEFELVPLDPTAGGARPVEDVLCVVERDRDRILR